MYFLFEIHFIMYILYFISNTYRIFVFKILIVVVVTFSANRAYA